MATQMTSSKSALLRRREAEQLAAIVTASSDAILTATAAGEVLTWNAGAAHLFAVAARDVVGRNLRDSVPTLDLQEDNHVGGELRSGRAVHLDTTGLRGDGQRIDVSVALTPQMGPLGELSGVSFIIRDITERRAMERLQQEFLAMASHELRSPVAAIKGHAQLMRRRGSYGQNAVDMIVAQADQLGRLVGDLLLASQIEADRLDLRLLSIDLVEVARAAADQLRAQGYRVRLEAPSESIPVSADRQRLGQVFANLLTNAVKYSPQGSEVVLEVERDGAEARAAVIDHGIGIAPDSLPRLLDRFFRVDGSAERAQGLGLGLFITRRIVEAHNGRISVASDLGHGSTFTVTLPIHLGPDERA
jgi:PAS domain S-box-containing protein